jgi:hypothetical protein
MYPSAERRISQRICQPCIAGNHSACPSPDCPCLCNDPDAKLPSKKTFGPGPRFEYEAVDPEVELVA